MAKRTKNKEKDNQVIYKTIHRKLKIDQHESHKKREWIQVLRKIKQFRFSSGSHSSRYSYQISGGLGKYGIVIARKGAYPWSFVTQNFGNQVSDDFNLTTRNLFWFNLFWVYGSIDWTIQ
jgi:hypothetical protein